MGAYERNGRGYVSMRGRRYGAHWDHVHTYRTAAGLVLGVSHSRSGLSAPDSRGKRRGASVSWAWLFLLSAAEDLPQLKLDDVPYLLTVRYFSVGHEYSFFRV